MAGSSSSRGAAVLRALRGAGGRPRPGDGTRHLSSCGILATPQAPKRPPAAPAWVLQPPARTFLNLAAPGLGGRRIEYSEARVLGYSMEQMYNVVANVESYQLFVPWCKSSRVLSCRKGLTRAELEVGFAPLVERYVSEISLTPQHQIRVVCNDSRIFSHLETLWRFSPGLPGQPDTCTLDFYVSIPACANPRGRLGLCQSPRQAGPCTERSFFRGGSPCVVSGCFRQATLVTLQPAVLASCPSARAATGWAKHGNSCAGSQRYG
ncbi:homeobox protein HMX2-like [Platysternon megacephalum]|uniref:Homeobox protein HMX2-like n=1 Tax=Platysternon megacephalum TaxID=55544 RepID=A0A4D9EUE4_9SAUR|nr:homeobox protein HMX2-like [Platysternon megacephalum]